jgi:hypothetical protein
MGIKAENQISQEPKLVPGCSENHGSNPVGKLLNGLEVNIMLNTSRKKEPVWVLVLSRRVNLIKSSRAISRVRCTLYTTYT